MKHGKRNRKFQTWQPLLRGLLIILMVLSFDTLSAPIYATGNTNEIVLAGDTPFNIRSSKIIIATLEEALNRLGREFSPVLLPSKRALQVANDNQIDGLLHRVANFHEITNHQYPNLIRVESPVFSIYWSGFANDKDIQIDNWADLKNYTVGYMRGVVYVEKKVNDYVPNDHIHTTSSLEQAFKMLSAGRIDVVPCAKNIALDILASLPETLSDIREVVEFGKTDIHVFLHKEHEELALKLSETLDAMKADGTFQTIYETADK